MIILFYILLYIIVVVFVCAVFSVMNKKYDWLDPDDVPWPLIGVFWPVAVPVILIIWLSCILYESVYSFLDKKINGY